VEVVAQWVRTSWTTASRGGTAAARRNAVPVAFVLPVVTPPVTHDVRLRERDDFVAHEVVQEAEPDPEDVLLRWSDDRLRVELVATPFGMPRRWRRPPAVWLRPGEWVRWQINYRFTDHDGDWTYRLDTLSLAHGPVATNTFLGTPTRVVDERSSLR
jgi:hypothetical protein